MKLFCILMLIGFGFHRNASIDEGLQLDQLDEVCDTITTKEFLSLSKQVYNKLPSIGRASDDEKIKAIKIYNTILMVNSTRINSRVYIRNFQFRFDKYYKFPLHDEDIIYSSKLPIVFKKLGVSLWNRLQLLREEILCQDYYMISDEESLKQIKATNKKK